MDKFISLVQCFITNLIGILYLSTYHISVLILFMVNPQLTVHTEVSSTYELKKNRKVFTSKYAWDRPSSFEKGYLTGRGLTKVVKNCAKGTNVCFNVTQ